jgi:hypothetical protein
LQKYSKTSARIFARHEDSVNKGRHVIHTGGQYDSYVIVPIVPIRYAPDAGSSVDMLSLDLGQDRTASERP